MARLPAALLGVALAAMAAGASATDVVCKTCPTKEIKDGRTVTFCQGVSYDKPVFLDRVEAHAKTSWICSGSNFMHFIFKEGKEHDMEVEEAEWHSIELQHDNLQYNAGEDITFEVRNKNAFCDIDTEVKVCFTEEHLWESSECVVKELEDGAYKYFCDEITNPDNTEVLEVLVYTENLGGFCDYSDLHLTFPSFPGEYEVQDRHHEKTWATIDLRGRNVKYPKNTPMQFTIRNDNAACDVRPKIRLHYKIDLTPDKRETFDGFYEPGGDAEVTKKGCDEIKFKGGKCNCNTKMSGAIMHIENCRDGDLIHTDSKLQTDYGVKSTWDAPHCKLEMSGEATIGKYMELLKGSRFYTKLEDREERCVNWQLGHAEYDKENTHFYKHYQLSEARKYNAVMRDSWIASQYFCAHPDQDQLGLVGYLTTITSGREKKWVEKHMDGDGFLGASDVGEEGQWRWIVGPEGCPGGYQVDSTNVLRRSMCDVGMLNSQEPDCRGTECNQGLKFYEVTYSFWTGYKFRAVAGQYHNFNGGEPNNGGRWSPLSEHFLHNNHDFTWNDDRNNPEGWFSDPLEGFTCEFGGVGELCVTEEDLLGRVCLKNTIDECTYEYECDHCAGDTCSAFDQDCEDPNHSGISLRDWKCICKAPTTGEAVAMTATCKLDECMHGDGVACVNMDQDCNDPVPTAMSLMDFVCKCKAPGLGEKTGGVATCTLDECVSGAGKMECSDGQSCKDDTPTPDSLNDYVCTCPPPSTGSAKGAKAMCVLDECDHGDGKKCKDAGQTCNDPDTAASKRGDYVCTCPMPSTDTATGAVAVCTIDECMHGDGKTLCADIGQGCNDPDQAAEKKGDFVCTCVAPQTGTATGAAATCELDECADGSELKNKCSAKDQLCIDPTPKVPGGDAYCKCKPPAVDLTKVGDAVADCSWDECITHDGTCIGAAQECFDPDQNAAGDWECRCIDPQLPVDAANPHGAQRPAACKDPPGDCQVHGHICHDAGQLCDPGASTDGEFTCTCTSPSVGDATKNGPATCELDECAVTCVSCEKTAAKPAGTCGDQGCVDEDKHPEKTHDWKCVCVTPYAGTKIGARAACTIDECTETCDHCAGTTCSDASQRCVDADVSTTGDWECVCPDPQVGSAVGKASECSIDECLANQAVCAGAGQTCEDPDHSASSKNDWECVCAAPSMTRQTAGAAECEYDECLDTANSDRCAAFNQNCRDKDLKTANTWECVCPDPQEGSRKLEPAYCTLDECQVTCGTCSNTGTGEVCAAAGQDCHDPNTSAFELSDWLCICRAPFGPTSAAGKAVETCEARNECKHPSSATQEGKHIVRYGNNECVCRAGWILGEDATHVGLGSPKTDANPTGGPCPGCCNPDSDAGGEWCFLDPNSEYNLNKDGCNPASTYFTDWNEMWMHCSPMGLVPQDGGVPMPIGRDVIAGIPNGESNVCTDYGQKCVDPSSLTDDDWYCECVLPLEGNPPMGMQTNTTCELDECNDHGATCASVTPPQDCMDPDKSPESKGDWLCVCTVGSPRKYPGMPVDECQLDECTELCPTCARQTADAEHPCTKVGQECVDDTWSTKDDKLGDWRCVCKEPQTGSALRAAAVCLLDECTAVCPTCVRKAMDDADVCAEADQTCEDRDTATGALGTWVCKCKEPSLTEATLKAVDVCEVDECRTAVCGANQNCVDNDLTKGDDYVCECFLPFHGSKVNGPAECKLDECSLEAAKNCTDAGQLCVDDDQLKDGSWVCRCHEPEEVGPDVVGGVATCKKSAECENNDVCTKAGQLCHDDTTQPAVMGNWDCRCIEPMHGDPKVGGPTVCSIDECSELCPTCMRTSMDEEGVCVTHNQTCTDNDQVTLGDWVCECVAPRTGMPQTKAAASCELDECTADCPTCAKDTCTAAGQDCVDTDLKDTHLNTWACKCKPPASNIATGQVVLDCSHDECSDAANAEVCTGAMPEQRCADPDPHTVGDWECHCKLPGSGKKTAAPADGCDAYNECTVVCDHCADSGNGNVCKKAGQTCEDPDQAIHNNWVCSCPTPSIGFRTGGAVAKMDCALDECTMQCETCADKGSGRNLCTAEGQECVEGAKHIAGKNDWVCQCAAPLEFVKTTGALAVCSFDECTQVVPGQTEAAGKVCADARQECHDTNLETLNDFRCSCIAPEHGSQTAGAASCLLDECVVHANNKTCTDAKQYCHETNTAVAGDWQCLCVAPATGAAIARPATCETDECTLPGNTELCASAGAPQKCVDPDKSVSGDWTCACTAPATGTGSQGEATCALDECSADCATCENNACGMVGQSCTDPDTRLTSTKDWMCECMLPSTDVAVGKAVAQCTVDECTTVGDAECGRDPGQKCVDPDPLVSGDWECRCQGRLTGMAVGGVATCELDECSDPSSMSACSMAGQQCVDKNKAPDSLNDFECDCIYPAVKVNGGVPAECSNEGECAYPENEEVCTSVGQSCRDPDATVDNNWLCECIAPARGMAGNQAAATCTLDECVAACATCENGVCSDAEQDCVDEDTHYTGAGLSTWECRCVRPRVGRAAGKVADCTLDECDLSSVCTSAGQRCLDMDKTKDDTWVCLCPPPSMDSASLAPAMCTVDECLGSGGVCEAAGQECVDMDLSADSMGTWECRCAAPSTTTAMGMVAQCEVNECDVYGAACTGAEQECVDEDPTQEGEWYCTCPSPIQDQREKSRPATCVLDECKVGSAMPAGATQDVCAAGGQTCEDPDTGLSARDDWICKCKEPSKSSAVGALASCAVDECEVSGKTCTDAGQVCEDADFGKDGDWVCRCVMPAIGEKVAGAASCLVDECVEVDVCRTAGQICNDPNPSAGSTDDWECQCAPASGVMGTKKGGAADCSPPPQSECSVPAIAKVCTDAGQVCSDPDESTPNNWECRCVEPASPGSATMKAAMCVLDECKGVCASCQNGMCDDHDQDCSDPNTDAQVLNDWTCTCKAPKQGMETANKAMCVLDECSQVCATCANTGMGNVCTGAEQACEDTNTDARSTGDWQCVCLKPTTGVKALGVATCTRNECEETMVCENAGQTCHDPDVSPSSTGDWRCTCRLPQTGSALISVASCELDECNVQSNADKCIAAGQMCVDPTPSLGKNGDWECRCAVGSSKGVAGAAECKLNECEDVCKTCANTGSGNVCTQNEQVCEDPTDDPAKTGDWQCVCPGAGGVRATAAAAVCEVDECTAVTNNGARTCLHAPRYTTDGCRCECGWSDSALPGRGYGKDEACKAGCCNPDRKPEGDWCKIDMSHPENAGKACAAETWGVCKAAETAAGVAVANVCTEGGQLCEDPDKHGESRNDWRCMCAAPQTATTAGIKGALLTCELDECNADCDTCQKGKCGDDKLPQVCVDDNKSPTSTGDWKCACPDGATGTPAMGARASCEYKGECGGDDSTAAQVCAAAGQLCVDADPTKAGDWVCSCPPPSTGASRPGSAASCVLDECVAKCPTCENGVCTGAEQVCEDASKDPQSLSDWVCRCRSPYTGEAKAAVAQCGVNECTAFGGTHDALCVAAGQKCVDANEALTGDWKCECVAPQTGSATGGAAQCSIDECTVDANNKACTAAGQSCVDPSTSVHSLGDWQCVCIQQDGTEVTAVAGPAACDATGWCKSCADAGQQCVPGANGQGSCRCVAPQTGADKAGGPAACELDECTASCATCAGTVCVGAEQECEDANKAPDSLNDWVCKCVAPSTATGKPAVCTVNECESHTVCEEEEQSCVDPDLKQLDDWYCECAKPKTGKRVGGVAACELDECILHEGTCTGAAQVCIDHDRTSKDSWKCHCVTPAKGEQVAGVAECTHEATDECSDEATRKVCADVGQACVDPSPAQGDWTCKCVAPQSGTPGQQAPASCKLDECTARCASCAQQPGTAPNVCTAGGQTCVDVSTDPASRGDWECRCVAPQTGVAQAALAACSLNECEVAANRRVCESVVDKTGAPMQQCVDPSNARGDWECRCIPPRSGAPAVGAPAKCGFDECTDGSGGAVCAAAGQTCTDPSRRAEDNWICVCPYTQESKVGAPVAGCKPTGGLCAMNGDVCTKAGQVCVERNDEWFCKCVAPSVGEQAGAAVARCALDECTAMCESCAQKQMSHTCTDADQLCTDPFPYGDSKGDWFCMCKDTEDIAMAQVATCGVDECAIDGETCTKAGQTCIDPDQSMRGDWMCRCVAPASGTATGAAAKCAIDECVVHGSKCEGQECLDVNTLASSLDDWYCKCGHGATGMQKGGPAECTYTYGGCSVEANRLVCEANGQVCVPGLDTSDAMDWRCACPTPSKGEPQTKGLATCVLDECAVPCATCAKASADDANVCQLAEQECVDKDLSPDALGTWVCKCFQGGQENPRAPVAVCTADECAPGAVGHTTCTAAEQLCVDLDTRVDAPNTWWCRCRHAAGLQNFGAPVASCGTNECTEKPENAATCADAGQECVDASTTMEGDWGCRCTGAAVGSAMGGVADCVYPDGDECGVEANRRVCIEAEQACEDTNPRTAGDWVCVCLAPAVGRQVAGAAVCELDECTTPLSQCGDCAGTTCGADQICVDADKSPAARGDWTCNCAAPAVGSAVAGRVDKCSINECELPAVATVCTEGSTCVDANQDTMNDWRCVCAGSAVYAVAGPVVCRTDECLVDANRAVCESVMPEQLCFDPDQGNANNWECRCATGDAAPAVMAPVDTAKCGYTGECADADIRKVCEAEGQLCTDADPNTAGDWTCICMHGLLGAPGMAMAARCGVDECARAACTSNVACPYQVCASAGQLCRDNAVDYSITGDWVCQCPPPSTALAVASVVEDCGGMGGGVGDECSPLRCLNDADCPYRTCRDAAQICRDPEPEVANTWQCHCNTTKDEEAQFAEQQTVAQCNINGAADDEDDECTDSWIVCYWWVLLLLLCCCCLLIAALLLVKRRSTNATNDGTKWNKQFEARADEKNLEEFDLDELDKSRTNNTSMSYPESELSQGLLASQSQTQVLGTLEKSQGDLQV